MRLIAGIVIGLLLALSLVFMAAESAGWLEPGVATHWIEAAGATTGGQAAMAAAIAGLLAADLVLPVPSSLVMTLAGRLLGTAAGTLASFVGSMAGAGLGYGLCRRYGRPAFERLAGTADVARVERFMARYGVWAILLSRSVPMLTEVVSCVAGLSRLPARTFATLAAAGTLPLCVVYAWAGSRGDASSPLWALLLALGLPALGLRLARGRSH